MTSRSLPTTLDLVAQLTTSRAMAAAPRRTRAYSAVACPRSSSCAASRAAAWSRRSAADTMTTALMVVLVMMPMVAMVGSVRFGGCASRSEAEGAEPSREERGHGEQPEGGEDAGDQGEEELHGDATGRLLGATLARAAGVVG